MMNIDILYVGHDFTCIWELLFIDLLAEFQSINFNTDRSSIDGEKSIRVNHNYSLLSI